MRSTFDQPQPACDTPARSVKGHVVSPSDFAITMLGTLALLVGLGKSYVQPDYMLALQQYYGLQITQLGTIASGENAAIAIGCAAAGFMQRRITPRVLAMFAAIAMIGNLASLLAKDFGTIMTLRMVTGLLGEGPLAAMAYRVVATAVNSERALAIAVTAEGVMGAIVLGLEPPLIDRIGPAAMLFPYGLVAGAIVVWAIVTRGRLPLVVMSAQELAGTNEIPVVGRGALARSSLLAPLVILLSIGVYTAAASGMWTFTATAAGSIGTSAPTIARALSIGTFLGIAGTILPAFLGSRFGWSWPVAVCCIGTILSAWFLMIDGSFVTIAASAMVLQMFWGMNVTYMATGLMERDRTTRVVAFASIASIAGTAVGASVFGWAISSFGYAAMVPAVATGCCIATALFLFGMLGRFSGEATARAPRQPLPDGQAPITVAAE